jgi:hypothetical protein
MVQRNATGVMSPLVFFSAVLLTACSTTASVERDDAVAKLIADDRTGDEVDRICFSRGIDRFKDATRHSVVLTEGVDDDYLVLVRQCAELDRAQSLRLDNRGQCLRRYDRIRVYETAFGTNVTGRVPYDLCVIEAIYEWDRQPDDEAAGS